MNVTDVSKGIWSEKYSNPITCNFVKQSKSTLRGYNTPLKIGWIVNCYASYYLSICLRLTSDQELVQILVQFLAQVVV